MRPAAAKSLFILFALYFFLPHAFCADVPSGKIIWWGNGFFRGCGFRETNGIVRCDRDILDDVVAVAQGSSQGLALKKDGTVFSFGIGTNRFRAGNDANGAIKVIGLSNVVSIATEGDACWAIKRDGTVARWGGNNDEANVVSHLTNIISIACSGNINCFALRKDGVVLAFRLANEQSLIQPVKVNGHVLSNIVAIASGDLAPVVLNKSGQVLGLGYQTPGLPPVEPRYEMHGSALYEYLDVKNVQPPFTYTTADPIIVNGEILSNVVALSSGVLDHLALKSNGTVVAFSYNSFGAQIKATEIHGLSNVVAVTDGKLALKRDGLVVSLEHDDFKQVGPPGLSNVVAIAYNLAVTTGNIPPEAHIKPHGRLEEMQVKADLIFKGQALGSMPITNNAFTIRADVAATQFKVISILQGILQTNIITLQHYASGPKEGWIGPSWAASYQFKTGQSYLVFAVNLSTPDNYYSPTPQTTNIPNVFRQIADIPKSEDDGVTQTLDSRPVDGLSIREAHWLELNLLLNDSNPADELHAIDALDHMSLPGRGLFDDQEHSDDFTRKDVLAVLLPFTTNNNQEVSIHALNCFETESNAAALAGSFAGPLIYVANDGLSSDRRLTAIAGLGGTHFEYISNSLNHLLQSSDENTRTRAVGLLVKYPNDFTEQALRNLSTDGSAQVRAKVAEVIGNGKMENLLPTLEKLFFDPEGLKEPLPPLTVEDLLVGGGGPRNNGDVHTSTGNAFLNFNTVQVSAILQRHLDDPVFRFQFLCKLAEENPKPWLNDLIKIMETKGQQNDSLSPGTLIFLNGTYYKCWYIIYNYLNSLPLSDFADGKFDHYFDVLEENGSNAAAEQPNDLYELYRKKGLEKRAAELRIKSKKRQSFDISSYFNGIDSEFTNSPMILN